MTYQFIEIPFSFEAHIKGQQREDRAHDYLYDKWGRSVVALNESGEPDPQTCAYGKVLLKKNKRGWVALRRDKCSRCGGQGGSQAWSHTGWKCYRCHGEGTERNLSQTALYTADAAEKLCARRAAREKAERAAAEKQERARAEREAAAREARIAELSSDERYVALCNLKGAFAGDIRSRLEAGKNWDDFSDKQRAVVDHMIATAQVEANVEVNSQHIGSPKERFAFEATVVASRQIGTEAFYPYSARFLNRLVTTDGNVIVWFSTTHLERFVGKQVTGKATVKKHDTYRDTAQTIVTRLKVDNDA